MQRFIATMVLLAASWCFGADVVPNLGAAWDEVGYINFRGASPDFERARKLATRGTDAWVEASLGLALCLHHRQPDVASDKARAAELYDELIAETEDRPVQALVMLLRARIEDQVDFYGDIPDVDAAGAIYRKLLKRWPESPLADRAALYLAQNEVFTMRTDAAQKGVEELRQWLRARPENPLAALQWILIGRACMTPLDEPAAAATAFRNAEAAGLPRHVQLDAFYWMIAGLSERAGDQAAAIRYYRRIIEEVKRSNFAYEAQERLRALGVDPPPLVDPFADEPGAVAAAREEAP